MILAIIIYRSSFSNVPQPFDLALTIPISSIFKSPILLSISTRQAISLTFGG
jgi:hypothetical protein